MNELVDTTRVFVSEFVTGGAWPESLVPDSLRIEGQAMAVAVAADLAALECVRVVTTWDARLGESPFPAGVEMMPVGSPDAERERFRQLAATCGATLIIAPEFDGLLEERRRTVDTVGGRALGCPADAIALCADKLALAEHLGRRGLPVIPTRLADPDEPPTGPWPLVLKPRDGAGSLNVRRLADPAAWRAAWRELPRDHPAGFVMQPLVPGEPLSVAAIVGHDGAVDVFPVARQRLSDDGRFTYQGGEVPAPSAPRWQMMAEELVRTAVAAVSGLFGYIGFDLVGDTASGRLWLVEINPRLTTSYIGYRALAAGNLAAKLFGSGSGSGSAEPARWQTGTVRFTAAGAVTRKM